MYVKTRVSLPRSGEKDSWDGLDVLVDGVEADGRTLGASVAGEDDGASVFLSVDADSPTSARAVAEEIVAGALQKLGLPAEANALQLYDSDGNFIP